MTTNAESTFLGLPAELRNRIYQDVLAGTEVGVGGGWLRRSKSQSNSSPPGILLVCHQMHNEAIGIYYHATTFIAVFGWRLAHWLKHIPHQHFGQLVSIRYDAHRGRPGKTFYDLISDFNDLEYVRREKERLLSCLSVGRRQALQQSRALQFSFRNLDGKVTWSNDP